MTPIYMFNCDPCYRCGLYAHYYVIWGKLKEHTMLCSNCLLHVAEPDVEWPLDYIFIQPIPYATYMPWLYRDYWQGDQQEIFDEMIRMNKVGAPIDVQRITNTQTGQEER